MELLSSNEDLNSYFQSMSEFSQEESDWNLNSKFLISKIKNLSQITSLESAPNPVEFDVFGSTSEDLKFCLPNDIGDIDIMVYPVSDEVTIDDSEIEIADGVSPVFVRLRGTSHPVFSHCMVENSEFVSTSALKDFHPKIFGGKREFLSLIPRIFARVDAFGFDDVASGFTDNRTGPSLGINVKHSSGSITEQVSEQVAVFNTMANSDEFRNFLEWFAIILNPQRTFTEEHSACIDDFVSVVQDKAKAFMENPSVESYLDTLDQMLSGEHNSKIQQKVKEIDQRVQVSATAETSCASSADTANSFTDIWTNATSSRASSSLSSATKANTIDEGTSLHNSTVNKTTTVPTDRDENINSNRETSHVVSDNHNIDKYEAGITERKSEREEKTSTGGEPSKTVSENVVTTTAGEENSAKQMTASDVQKVLRQQLLDGICAQISPRARTNPATKHPTSTTAMDQHPSKTIQSGVDLVPALKGRGWPKVARAWSTRARLWPSQDTISKILESGFHVVVKSPHGNTNHAADQFFRLSFSRAELILSGELNNIQRECYRCLKRYYRYVIEGRQVKIITSYFLKTVLLWCVEETGPEFWSEENRAKGVLTLLERLLKYLESKFLPLYFIPEVNLLENAIIDHPKEVEYIASQFRKIYENPRMYPTTGGQRTTLGNVTTPEGVLSDAKNASQDNTCITDVIPPPCSKEAPQDIVDAVKPHVRHSSRDFEVDNGAESIAVSKPKPQETASTSFFVKYSELQAVYKQVYKELIDMVLHGNGSQKEDPVVQAIIENLQAVASKMANPQAELTRVLEFYSNAIYTSYVLHPGATTRQKILSALKGYSEIFSFTAAQDDLLAEGNEHQIVARMLNSNSFDLTNALMPNCFIAFKELIQILEAPISKSLESCEDEIPLD